jgi:signal transduction histidine kinase
MSESIDRLRKDADVRIAITTGSFNYGEFLLGMKRSGDPYTSEDLSLVRTFSSQATVAFQKAELYEKLKRHNDELEEKVRERTAYLDEMRRNERQFMDDISHALKTPLSILKSAHEQIQKNGQFEDRETEVIERCINQLSERVSDLLTLARLEATEFDTPDQVLNLSNVLCEVCEYVNTVCAEHMIDMQKHITDDIYLFGNLGQIEEMLTNIIANSIRHTTTSCRKLISIRLSSNANEIFVTIQDTGTGISPDEIAHIFERFYSGKDSNGSGLGLAIAERIAHKHSGTICAESKLGKGTKITITLPRYVRAALTDEHKLKRPT